MAKNKKNEKTSPKKRARKNSVNDESMDLFDIEEYAEEFEHSSLADDKQGKTSSKNKKSNSRSKKDSK